MDGASINAAVAPRSTERRLSKLEERVSCLETQSARVEERADRILATVERIEERVYQGHGDNRLQGGVQSEDRRSRGELLKTITLIVTTLAALIAAAGVVLRNL